MNLPNFAFYIFNFTFIHMILNKLTIFGTLISLVSISTACSSKDDFVRADNPNISYMGRHIVIDDGTIKFNYPGFTAMLNFTGESLDMFTNPGSGYWMVEVDDQPAVKKYVSPNDSILSVAAGLSDDVHSARITYCIEGYELNPEVRGFSLADNCKLLEPSPKGDLKIEFIGNSITCGYGTEANSADIHFSYDTQNHCLSYAYLTARNLNADFNVVARSGIGVYRNYNGPKEGNDKEIMPLEYPNALVYEYDSPWDFNKFTPDIVCINLGTNDLSTNNYDATLFEDAYGKFVDTVRVYYPNAKIVLLTGAMLNDKPLEDEKTALDNVAKDRDNVYRFDMTPQDGSLGYGADYHPSAAQSQKMAEELTAYLKQLTTNNQQLTTNNQQHDINFLRKRRNAGNSPHRARCASLFRWQEDT